MKQNRAAAMRGGEGRQRLRHVAEHQRLGRRQRTRIGPGLAIEGVDRTLRQGLAQMVVGPAIAEAEFKHEPVPARDGGSSPVQNPALGLGRRMKLSRRLMTFLIGG